jgi:glycosyltransferase involved in cell wall biosynthesis
MISVITPCYNHGHFLDDAIDSLKGFFGIVPYEHIIINDGSTDINTIEKLKMIEESHVAKVIHQENQGLAKARNAGIKASRGTYILPLDSDNKIITSVFSKAYQIMNEDTSIDVVYTDVEVFGEQKEITIVGDFDMKKLLVTNYIDACALIRKETLLSFGNYDPLMPVWGCEDWELWVRLGFGKAKFFYLNETGYKYRLLSNSMARSANRVINFALNKEYIFRKNAGYIMEIYHDLYSESERFCQLKRNPLKFLINFVKIRISKKK